MNARNWLAKQGKQAERLVWPRKLLEVGWLLVKIVYPGEFCGDIWGLFG
jgi:hypothetical protein